MVDDDDAVQVTLLVLWLMDVHLAELSDSRCAVASERQATPHRHRRLVAHVHAFMQRADVMVSASFIMTDDRSGVPPAKSRRRLQVDGRARSVARWRR